MKRFAAVLASLLFLSLLATPAAAQSWKDLVKQKAKEKASEIGKSKPQKAPEKKQEQAADEQESTEPTEGEEAEKPSQRPGEGAWANYDFVRGEKVLFAEDFTKDRVGNFPKRLELDRGNMEVVEWKGQRLLRATDHSGFTVILPQKLSQRFTIEFDLLTEWGDWGGMQVWTAAKSEEREDHFRNTAKMGILFFGPRGSGLVQFNDVRTPEIEKQLNHIRIAVDGDYMKAYVNERRVVNAPKSGIRHTDMIHFNVFANDETQAVIGNLVVAAGGQEMYEAISSTGRFATQGILFDTGSDRIRPESTPTLSDIAAMLTDHPELKLTIEGHTDNVGDPAANKTLSTKRAEAVKAYLVSKHGLDGSRLETAGFGDTKPASPNTTAEGRQQNRRVELVKM